MKKENVKANANVNENNAINNIDDITKLLGCKVGKKETSTVMTSVEKRLLNEIGELIHNHLLEKHSDKYYEMEADIVEKKTNKETKEVSFSVNKKRGYFIQIEDDIEITEKNIKQKGYRLFSPTTYMKGGKTNVTFYPPKKVGNTINK